MSKWREVKLGKKKPRGRGTAMVSSLRRGTIHLLRRQRKGEKNGKPAKKTGKTVGATTRVLAIAATSRQAPLRKKQQQHHLKKELQPDWGEQKTYYRKRPPSPKTGGDGTAGRGGEDSM